MSGDRYPWRGPTGPGNGRILGALPDLHVFEIHCDMTNSVWTPVSAISAHQVVLMRAGGFAHRCNGVETFVSTSTALVLRPGDEIQVAHPVGHGDAYLVLQYDRPLDGGLRHGAVPVDDRADLCHRRLAAECAAGIDRVDLADRIEGLLRLLAAPGRPEPVSRRPGTEAAHRRLVDGLTALLLADGYRLSLPEIAQALSTSPYHLSRVVHRVTGTTLGAYRNRLRVRAVLGDVAAGATNLRELAAGYGFADQSHLIRVVRAHVGRTPGQMRSMLGGGPERSSR